MKNIYSNIYSFNKKILKKTVESLKRGNIVGLPTETVYGLAGNAYSKASIKKIYKLKKRPKVNPLIIHYTSLKDANKDVIFNKNFFKLYKKFCPGPITFVLKKRENTNIDKLATAGLNTVAIRFPKNNIVKTVIRSSKFPLAMPSANLSSRLSPINALDVYEEFQKKIKIIINGGKSKIGIESTVLDLTDKPRILRPGIISSKEIKKFLKTNLSHKKSRIKSPGMLKKHYSPGIPVIIGRKPSNINDAFIIFGNKYKKRKNFFDLSKNGDLKEAAANLYKIMRKIKKKGYKRIFVSKVPNYGPGIAINDRLKKASQ